MICDECCYRPADGDTNCAHRRNICQPCADAVEDRAHYLTRQRFPAPRLAGDPQCGLCVDGAIEDKRAYDEERTL